MQTINSTKIIYKFLLKMSVSTTEGKKCRIMKGRRSTNYNILVFYINTEAVTGGVPEKIAL